MAGSQNINIPKKGRITLTRSRPSFTTRTATDDAAQLLRRASLPVPAHGPLREVPPSVDGSDYPDEHTPTTREGAVTGHEQATHLTRRASDRALPDALSQWNSGSKKREHRVTLSSPNANNGRAEKGARPKVGTVSRPVGGTDKLNTYSGVFVPTSLNVLSILMFIRFGFILGQSGVLGMFGMLIVAYLINLVTTMSISAVASNGTVRGGGAYYMISRSLGPEFGGSIGIVFFLGFVFNTGMNAVGLIDCLNQNFGSVSGDWANILPEESWWPYCWSTLVLVICTAVCLAGSSIFARASNGLLVVLIIATLSIPVSALVRRPFDLAKPEPGRFTGLSLSTLRENLLPRFTRGAAGSQLHHRENFADLFGILFPATGGIFAGASMSGDLKNPSKSIPQGTLYGLALTFVLYALVILAMGASITRDTLYRNVNVVQETNMSGILILLGEIATTCFSVLMGVIGPAKLLQAIARDSVLPGLSIFGQGTKKLDEPVYAILLTYVAAQLTMLFDINEIASFITMAYLMTFFVTNLACALLKASSAPNFRPSFHYFNIWTAALGAILSIATMFFVDGVYAMGCSAFLIVLFLVIHYTTPPKSWGDVSQSLIYHQVRKYLLRLKTEHVKFWRPQILLFVNDPRRGYKLIKFCNSLKKGALFILGHVIVTQDFGASVPEARRHQAAWTRFVDTEKIKAFVNVAISPSVEWGTRNIVLSAGLGGMRPNIVIMGFYNLQEFRQEQPLVDVPSPPPERKDGRGRKKRSRSRGQLLGELPTDTCHVEGRMDMQSYVKVLEDMILKLRINLAIAVGFANLELPDSDSGGSKKYIDLWPVQMSAEIEADHGPDQRSIMTTNFDTYTLIMQLGCILHTVPAWKKLYKLRVAVFVDYESEVQEERERVAALLDKLRIEAEVLVFWLAAEENQAFQMIVNGHAVDADVEIQVEKTLEDDMWWQSVRRARGRVNSVDVGAVDELLATDDVAWLSTSLQPTPRDPSTTRFQDLQRLMDLSRGRRSFGALSRLGVNPGMRTHRLNDDLISLHASHASASESSTSSEIESISDARAEEGSEDEDSMTWSHSASERTQPGQSLDDEAAGHPSDARRVPASSKRSSKKSSIASVGHTSSQPALPSAAAQAHDPVDIFDMQDPVSTSDGSPASPEDQRRGRPATPKAVYDAEETSPVKSPTSPVPTLRVTSEEAVGPAIMFAEAPHPRRQRQQAIQSPEAARGTSNHRSIYHRQSDAPSPSSGAAAAGAASGFPAPASIPLSFNTLPCRAQHLILNELIARQSDNTAVIFTTLPPPLEGTWESESESLGYVSDLEVLVGGLPPVLLVHSNSMTVTMSL